MTSDSSHAGRGATGTLYVVATPIGNMDDLTLRALATLQSVEVILCEDTRHTRALLARHGIAAATESYHEHNEVQKTPGIVTRLEEGASMALVSDAGTPTVSDPGYRLLNALRGTGVNVIPIPGASSVTTLLSVSGLPTDRFVFEGFLPVKKGKRQRRLDELAAEPRTIVLFESPHRIARTLAECLATWGDRPACLGRELTKKFEEIRRAPLSDLVAHVQGRTVKGEITLAVGGQVRTADE